MNQEKGVGWMQDDNTKPEPQTTTGRHMMAENGVRQESSFTRKLKRLFSRRKIKPESGAKAKEIPARGITGWFKTFLAPRRQNTGGPRSEENVGAAPPSNIQAPGECRLNDGFTPGTGSTVTIGLTLRAPGVSTSYLPVLELSPRPLEDDTIQHLRAQSTGDQLNLESPSTSSANQPSPDLSVTYNYIPESPPDKTGTAREEGSCAVAASRTALPVPRSPDQFDVHFSPETSLVLYQPISIAGDSVSAWPSPPLPRYSTDETDDCRTKTTPSKPTASLPVEPVIDLPPDADAGLSPEDKLVPFKSLPSRPETTYPRISSQFTPFLRPTSDYLNHLEGRSPLPVGISSEHSISDFPYVLQPSSSKHGGDGTYPEETGKEIAQRSVAGRAASGSMASPQRTLLARLFSSSSVKFLKYRDDLMAHSTARGSTPFMQGHIIGEVDSDESEYSTISGSTAPFRGGIIGEADSYGSEYITTPGSTPLPSVAGDVPDQLGKEFSSRIDIPLSKHTVSDSEVDEYKLETEFRHNYVVHTMNMREPYAQLWERPTWKQHKKIGRGAFGDVWLEKKRGRDELRAVKKLHREILPKSGFSQELRALINLKECDHLFVRFLGWYEHTYDTFLAMEYIENGDLDRYISTDSRRAQANTPEITRQILEGLEVLHKRRICHRDLKPQNILVASLDPIWVKIADFGTSKQAKNTLLRTRCGTTGYLAPEVLGIFPNATNGPVTYTFALDIWSLGSMVHMLLTSQAPFAIPIINSLGTEFNHEFDSRLAECSETDMESLFKYCQGAFEFPIKALEQSHVSKDGIAFVRSLLMASPKDRPSATDALANPWLRGYTSNWFESLKTEFLCLGLALDLGEGDVLVRQAANADIMRFLPTLSNESIPRVLLEAIAQGYKLAAAKLLESQSVDGLTKGMVFQLATRENGNMKKLLQYGLDDGACIDGQTVLQWMVKIGHCGAVLLLLENVPHINASTDCEEAFHVALASRNIGIVKIFFDNGFQPYKHEQDIAVLETVAEYGWTEIVTQLLDNHAGANDAVLKLRRMVALRRAAGNGHVEIVKLLLDSKSSVDGTENDIYQIALQASAEGGHIEIVKPLLSSRTKWHREELETSFQGAAEGGHIDIARLLLEHGADMNAGDGTALRLAAARGHIDITKLLLNPKVNLNMPLRAAAQGGHLEIFKLLINNGADMNATELEALQPAAANGHLSIVELLLTKEIAWKDGELGRALLGAAAGGYLGIIKLLLVEGVRPDEGQPKTALQAAIEGGHMHVVKLLLKNHANVNPSAKGVGCRTPLQTAAEGGCLDIVKLLVENKAKFCSLAAADGGRTALQAASGGGHIDVVRYLLERGAKVNAPAARCDGQTALQAAVLSGHINVVKLLLENKADMNSGAAKYSGRTALQVAAGSGHIDIANLLLDNDADVNEEGSETALEAAARGGYIDIVNLLLEYGVNVNSRTPLQAAVMHSHVDIVQLLLDNGANVNAIAPDAPIRTVLQAAISGSGDIELVRLLLKRGADMNIDATNVGGRTALEVASGCGRIDIVTLLLDQGADVNAAAPNGKGRTALQGAAEGGHIDIFNLLLRYGADVNAAPAEDGGLTALQAAAKGGHCDLVTLLLAEGAEVNAAAARFEGLTALQAAAKGKHINIVEQLLTSQAEDGETALSVAMKNGLFDIAQLLLGDGSSHPEPSMTIEQVQEWIARSVMTNSLDDGGIVDIPRMLQMLPRLVEIMGGVKPPPPR